MKPKQSFASHSASETIACGRKLARRLAPGTVVALTGDLGSGKTTLVKGIASGLGVRDRRQVHSPTFVIFHIYKGRFPLYHFDLYRLEKESDLDAIGIDEFLSDPSAVSVIEWADRIPSVFKRSKVRVDLLFRRASKLKEERLIQVKFYDSTSKRSGG